MIFNDFFTKTGRIWKSRPKFGHYALNANMKFQHASNNVVSHSRRPRHIRNDVSKSSKTNPKGSKQVWIPKTKLNEISALLPNFGKEAKEVVHRFRVLKTHDGAQGILSQT